MNLFAPSRHIQIRRSLLPKKFVVFQHLVTATGHADYIGQILLQWNYDVPQGIRFPSELAQQLQQVIPFFTIEVRGLIIDSPFCVEIMKLDQLPHHIREPKFINLCVSQNLQVVIKP